MIELSVNTIVQDKIDFMMPDLISVCKENKTDGQNSKRKMKNKKSRDYIIKKF